MSGLERWWSRWGDLAVPGVLVACLALTVARFPLAIHGDNALILSYAQRILSGDTPYVDFYEINPPLIMYLSIPPVLLGRLLRQNPIAVFNVMVIGACVWSALSIRRTMIDLGLPGRVVVLTLWLALAWSAQFMLTFGQREHLFVLGYVPFLFIRSARWSDLPVPRRRAIALGVVAGVAIAIKPQFALVAIIPELTWALRHRRWGALAAPEILSAAAIGLIYLLHFLVFPSIGRAYVLDLLPTLWSTYASFDDPWSMVATPTRVAWIAAAVGLAAFSSRSPRGHSGVDMVAGAVAFTVASFAFLYLLPQKMWLYHYEPAFHGSLLVIGLVIGRMAGLAGPLRWPGALAIALSALTFAVSSQLSPGVAAGQGVPGLRRLISERTRPGDTVMMLACSVPPTWPLLMQIDRRNASRYSSLVNKIPRFYPRQRPFAGYHTPAEMSADERRFLDDLRDDARTHPPELVVVHRDCAGIASPGFDLWTYLDEVGFIRDVFGGFEKLAPHEEKARREGMRMAFIVLARPDRNRAR